MAYFRAAYPDLLQYCLLPVVKVTQGGQSSILNWVLG